MRGDPRLVRIGKVAIIIHVVAAAAAVSTGDIALSALSAGGIFFWLWLATDPQTPLIETLAGMWWVFALLVAFALGQVVATAFGATDDTRSGLLAIFVIVLVPLYLLHGIRWSDKRDAP